jgi:hypothetical protein
MRRVSYHQSVFDLLGIQPSVSPQARKMIASWEKTQGRRLPEAVRQWYLVDRVVALRENQDEEGHLWYDFSNMDQPVPLKTVLRQFVGRRGEEPLPWVAWSAGRVPVLVENQGVCSWYVQPDGSDDPPVVVDESYDDKTSLVVEWVRIADRFSHFVFDWVARFYFEDWTPLSERSPYPYQRTRPAREKPFLNGLWLYAPDAEALAPPFLDFLIEFFTEDSREAISQGVMQYAFHDENGRVRVTTDEYGEEDGVSAWWLHADSREALFRLAKRIVWCCDLREKLRHWTKQARPVMDRLQAFESG